MKLLLDRTIYENPQDEPCAHETDGDLAWLGFLLLLMSAAVSISGIYWLISWAVL